jgi:hypothetical protein
VLAPGAIVVSRRCSTAASHDARGADIERARLALIQRHGPWTAANVDLGGGVYTIGPDAPTLHAGMVRFAQRFMDYTGKALGALRILDLACLDGEYAIEFAGQGAQVTMLARKLMALGGMRWPRPCRGRNATFCLSSSPISAASDGVPNDYLSLVHFALRSPSML